MLPSRHRMRRRGDFAAALKAGRRGASERLVVHVCRGDATSPCSVGLVVSRAVGGAVDRNLVRRRLRGLMADRLGDLAGSRVVVRALPGAAAATSAALGRDLDRALAVATGRRGVR